VSVDPAAGFVDVDLGDNGHCLPCGLNLSEASARAAAMIGVFNSIDHTVQNTQASFRRVRVHLRENCVVGILRRPASCDDPPRQPRRQRRPASDGRERSDDRTGGGRLRVLAVGAVVSGVDARFGAPFVNQLFTGPNGGAGGPHTDGWLTMSDLGSGVSLLLDSVEIDERKQPTVIFDRRLVPDSEAAGRDRGAPALRLEYGPVGCAIEAIYANDGAVNGTRGARRGLGGAPSGQAKRDATGALVEIDRWGPVRVEPGERIVVHTSGGSGFGSPLDRERRAVAGDVAEGWISAERARDVYGVIFDEPGEVDAEATEASRARLRDGVGA
jgi:N-methylhydantoinase B